MHVQKGQLSAEEQELLEVIGKGRESSLGLLHFLHWWPSKGRGKCIALPALLREQVEPLDAFCRLQTVCPLLAIIASLRP